MERALSRPSETRQQANQNTDFFFFVCLNQFKATASCWETRPVPHHEGPDSHWDRAGQRPVSRAAQGLPSPLSLTASLPGEKGWPARPIGKYPHITSAHRSPATCAHTQAHVTGLLLQCPSSSTPLLQGSGPPGHQVAPRKARPDRAAHHPTPAPLVAPAWGELNKRNERWKEII